MKPTQALAEIGRIHEKVDGLVAKRKDLTSTINAERKRARELATDYAQETLDLEIRPEDEPDEDYSPVAWKMPEKAKAAIAAIRDMRDPSDRQTLQAWLDAEQDGPSRQSVVKALEGALEAFDQSELSPSNASEYPDGDQDTKA